MTLSFPTSWEQGTTGWGTPERADPCACDSRALVFERADTCLRCGRYTGETIARTWFERAQRFREHTAAMA